MPSPPASGTDSGSRYLIASGTQSYLAPFDQLKRVPDELRLITELFREYGFEETLTDLRLNPTAQEFRVGLEDWLTDESRQPEEAAVVYYTGHGFTAFDGHYLAFRDTIMGKVARAVETSTLIRLVGPTPRVRRLLIIIDTCESGAGLLDAVQRAARAAPWQLPWQPREGIWVIAATRPVQDAAQGAFASAFVHAVRQTAETTGAEQEFLAMDVILDHINEQLRGSGQQATAAPMPYSTGLIPIFRNPIYRRRGAEPLGTDDTFTGRVRALADLRAWRDGTDPRPRVVTGDPGSGKSALLGRVAAMTEHVVSVSALKRTSQGLIADLATAAGQVRGTISELVVSVAAGTLITVDGLDEAVQPYDIMADVLAPLARAPVRLLIASRRPYHQRLPFAAEVIDLDIPRYYERADVRDYVMKLLASPAIHNPEAEAIAAVIAEQAGHSFLLARLAAITVRNQDRPPSAREVAELMAGWADAGAAFDADLERRFGGAAARVRELLTPLAWSYGPGLPWENLWADAATALSEGALPDGARYDDVDIRWVLDQAYSYLRESVDQGRSVYRLFHTELARHLRGDRDPAQVNRRFAGLLIRHVPAYGGRRDWQTAHPYVRRHLAEHAAAGGMLDELVTDPGFLLAAARPGLTRSVRSVTTPAGRAAASSYLRAASQLVTGELTVAERAAYLEFAARQDGNEDLARTASRLAAGSPWRARWTRWNRQHASRVLARIGKVRGLAWLNGTDGPLVAVATGTTFYEADPGEDSGRVSVHDFWTGEAVFAADLGESVWSLTLVMIGGEALLLAGDACGRLHVWRAADWQQVKVLQAHDRNLSAIWGGDVDGRPVLITCGRSAAAGDQSGPSELTVWDPRSWTVSLGPVQAFDGHVSHVDVLPLDRPAILVAGDPLHEPASSRTTARAFDLETGEQRFALPMSGSVLASALSLPRTPGRFVRSTDGTVELWDAAGPRCLHSTPTREFYFEEAVAAVATRLGDLLVVPRGAEIELYELNTLRLVVTMRGHGFRAKYLDAAEVDGHPFVVSATDEEVRVWDLADVLPRDLGEPAPTDPGQGVTAICGHPRGVLVARGDGRLAAINPVTGDEQQTWQPITGHTIYDLAATSASFGGPGRAFARVSDGLAMADLTAPDEMHALDPDSNRTRFAGVACTTVNDQLIVGACGSRSTVLLYDGATGHRVGALLAEAGWDDKSLSALAFTATEPRLVLAAGSNRHIVAWDLFQALAGRPVRVPLPDLHHDNVRAVATFAYPLGELIVSAGDDRGVVVTDPASGGGWRRDGAHADWIMAVAVLPGDSPVIATGSQDGYVGLWTLPEQGLRPLAMIAVGAPVTDLHSSKPSLLIVGTTSGMVALDVANPEAL